MALMNLLKNNTSSVVTGLKNTNSTVSGNTNAVTNKTSTPSTSGKLSMKDFNSNSTLVKKYGTYENYLNGNIVSTASGVKLNTADTVLNTSSPASATPTSTKVNTTPSFTSAEKLVDTASDKTIGSPVIPQANVQNQSQLGSHPGQIAYNEPMLNETPSAPSSEVQGEAIQAAYDTTQNIYDQKGTQDETQIPTQPTQTTDTNTNVAQDDSVNLGSNTTSDKVMSEEQFNANNGAGVSAAYGKDQSTLGIDANEGYNRPSTTQTASNILQTTPVDLTSGAKNVVSGTSTNRLLNQKKDETLTNLSNTVKNDTSNAMTFNVATALNGVKTQTNPLPAVTNPQYTETTNPQTTKPLMVEEAPEDTHTGFTTSSVIPTKVEEPKPTVEAQAPIEAAYGTPTTVGGNTSTSGYGYIDANGNVTTSANPTTVNKVTNDTPQIETQPFTPTVTEEKPPVTTTDTTQTTETTDTTPEPNYYKPPQTVTDVQQIETTSQYQKAEDQFKDDTGVNQQEYDALMEYLTNAKKSGTELAENLKNLMLNLSDEQRQLLYALASKKRELAEQTARNLRARAAADANTQYALNQANYGVQAEQLARMGLGTSGYSDYLTSAAYATNRAGIQNANVEAEKAIQSALEAENEAQTSAESAYKDAVASANKEYQTSLYDINSSTDKGVLSAYLDKLTSDADARKNLRNDYLSAYESDLAKAEAQAKLDEQTAQSELANKQNQFSNKDTLKEILSSDYTKYTASEIDNMVELGMITTDQATEAKETQSNAYLEELASIINNGNIDEIVAEKNRLGKMKGKYLTDDAYSTAMALVNKVTATTNTFTTSKYDIVKAIGNASNGGTFTVSTRNGKVDLTYGEKVDSTLSDKLDNLAKASGDLTDNRLIYKDGTLYKRYNEKWYSVTGDVAKLVTMF